MCQFKALHCCVPAELNTAGYANSRNFWNGEKPQFVNVPQQKDTAPCIAMRVLGFDFWQYIHTIFGPVTELGDLSRCRITNARVMISLV